MNKKTKNIVSNVCVVAAIVVALGYVVSRFVHFGRVEFTDNAQVRRHISPLNSRVQGYVKEVRFEDFQHVRKGDTLVVIDNTDFLLQLAQAEAALASARSGTRTASASVSTMANNVAVSDAQIAEAKANLDNAERNFRRFEELFRQNACTAQERDNVETAFLSAKARYEALLQSKQTTRLAVNEQSQRVEQTESSVKVAEAALDVARQNLRYTVITAPADGIVGKKEISEGQLVQPGQTLASLVWDDEVWIVANFRETQLQNIKVGCEVSITVDALRGTEIKGRVERLSNATGAAFSMIPQDNATGNFVKVEQRVPVRISLEGNSPEVLSRLKAGLNAECQVTY